MSDLTSNEKFKLEKLLNMESGYVLEFTNRGFKEFVLEVTEIDIYDDKYIQDTGSKANRLRAFWKKESNHIVGRLIAALLDYWQTQKLVNEKEVKPSQQELFNECTKISERLLREGSLDKKQDEIKTDPYFEEIRDKIVEQLKSAKFTIWVAVAWLTDPVLFNLLVIKKKEGVNVQLIINDDKINADSGMIYNQLETYKLKKITNYGNLMHNKFCIIDLKTVIHGSYNWTNRAQYNKETVSVEQNRQNAEKFAEEFIKLKKLSISSATDFANPVI